MNIRSNGLMENLISSVLIVLMTTIGIPQHSLARCVQLGMKIVLNAISMKVVSSVINVLTMVLDLVEFQIQKARYVLD